MNLLVLSTSYPAHPTDFRGRFAHDMAVALTRNGHSVTAVVPHPGGTFPETDSLDHVTILRARSAPLAMLHRLFGTGLFGRHGTEDTLRSHPWLAAEILPAMSSLLHRARAPARHADLIISHWLLPCGLLGAALSRFLSVPHLAVEHGAGLRTLARLPHPMAQSLLGHIAAHSLLIHLVASHQAEPLVSLLPPSSAPLLSVSPMPLPVAGILPSGAQISSVRMAPPEWGTSLLGQLCPPRHPERPDALPSASEAHTPHGGSEKPQLASATPLLFASRLVPLKGLDVLLAALDLLVDVSLTIAGDGPLRPRIQAALRSHRHADRIRLLGELPHPDLLRLMPGHAALIVPSLPTPSGLEGTPRVLLEGMAAGLVPVVSDAGGMTDVVSHEHNGLVVPAGSPAALADALARLARDPVLTRALAAAALETASAHTFDALFARWHRICPALPEF